MIKLKELWRQILAGIIAGAGFAAAYIGLQLIWWVALLIGVAVYGAALLLIERAPEDHEVYVHSNVTQHDVNEAVDYCNQASKQLKQASRTKHIDESVAQTFIQLSELIEHIGTNYAQDARDLKHSYSFIKMHLPKILAITEDYVSLSERTVSDHSQQRLAQVGHMIQDYLPPVQRIHDACLENDFEKLELETSVLGEVMKMSSKGERV